MPTITPPPPPGLQAAMPTPLPVVVVQNPPAALTQLNIGHILEATLADQIGKDMYTLKTPLGQLTVQTVLPLPKLANLILHLKSLSPSAQFIINSINGETPTTSTRPGTTAFGQPQDTISKTATTHATGNTPIQTGTGGNTAHLKAGATLQASLLRPLGQPAATQPQTAEPVGTTVTTSKPAAAFSKPVFGGLQATLFKKIGNIAARALPASLVTKVVPATAQKSTVKATAKNVSHQAQTPQAAAKTIGYLPAGSRFEVKINQIILPSPAATDATTTAKTSPGWLTVGRTMTGTVSGTTASGHPVIQTNSGVLSLKTQATLPRGSVITMDITSTPVAPKTDPAFHPGAERQNMFTSRKWPALEESIKALQEATPVSTQQLVQTVIPRPGPALTATVLFFLTALRGGDIRSWLGDSNIRTIERARPNLHGRLKDDFDTLGRIADDPGKGDWRVALVPVNTGEAMEQIRMLMRQGGDEDEDEDEKTCTRFIIDVVMSRLGRIQLDGLVRGEGKKLDLIVRSGSPLEEKMRTNIQGIYQAASHASGLSGGVTFQAAPPNFIDVADPISNDELGLVV